MFSAEQSHSRNDGTLRRRDVFFTQVQEVYPKPLTLGSWRESAREDLEADIRQLNKDLADMLARGKMRDTTKEKRAAEADRLIAKADSYRVLLGELADELGGTLTDLAAQFRDAIGQAAAEAERALDLDAPAEPQPEPQPELPRRGRRRVGRSDLDVFDL